MSKNEAIVQHLLFYLQNHIAAGRKAWGSYRATNDEVNIDSIFRELPALLWHFPHIDPNQAGILHFRHVQDWQQDFEAQAWGIQEPKKACPETLVRDLDGLIIPLVGFDNQGNRLGWGKGYYDRALQGFRGVKLGVAYALQEVDVLPVEDHDEPLTAVITENGVRTFGTS